MKKIITFMSLVFALILAGCSNSSVDYSGILGLLSSGPVLSPWTRLLGHASNNTLGYAVAMDPDGNSYATGETTGQLDPDRTGGIQNDVFVVKYDKDGVQQWVKQMGVEALHTYGRGVAADADGNSYVTGYTDANLVVGSGSSTGTNDLFVAKYDASGTRLWVKQLGVATKNTLGFGIAVDTDGNSYATGYTSADLDEGGSGVLTGILDFFIVKYDTSGNRQWIQQRGVSGVATIATGVAVDSTGYCFVTGRTEGDLDPGVGTLTGTTDVFVAKYTTSGNLHKVTQMGVAGKEHLWLGHCR